MCLIPPLYGIVMTIHSALAAQHAQKYARDDPYVLLGDFNFKPGSPQYDLLTKGTMDGQVREGFKRLNKIEEMLLLVV